MNIVTKGANYISEIEKRQTLLKQALLLKSRYPIMSDDDKANFDSFADMQAIFSNQVKEAELALKLGNQLLEIYEKYICKVKVLYSIISDFYTEAFQDAFNMTSDYITDVPRDFNYRRWVEKVTPLLLEIVEYSSHQYFLNQGLFCNPANNYVISEKTSLENLLPTTNFSQYFQKKTNGVTSVYTPLISASSIFNFEAIIGCDLSSKAITTANNALQQTVIATAVTNADNSLIGTIPGLTIAQLLWFDPVYLTLQVTTGFNGDFAQQSALDNNLSVFLKNIFTHLENVVTNQTSLQRQVYVIKAILECAQANVAFTSKEIEDLASVNDEQLVSMIESGNALKTQISKLPTIKTTSIFSLTEKNRCNDCFNIYF